MTEKPRESVCHAVLDAVLFSAGEDGSADRKELERTAVRNEAFANVAWHRWRTDHPGDIDLGSGEAAVAIESGLRLLAAEAISWLIEHGHLAESDGHVCLGSRQFGSYSPDTDRENDLFYTMRRVTAARLDLIRESMRELGDLRAYFPVLEDDQGNVVDGKHRRTIDPDWPAARIQVPRESRLAVATAANRSSPWTQRDWQDLLQHRQHISGRHDAIHAVVRLALLEDHERSDRKIAGLVGASPKTVAAIGQELEETEEIPQFTKSAGGRPRKDGTPAQPRQRHEALDAEVLRRVRAGEPVPRGELGAQFGVGERVVQDSYQRALGEVEAEAARAPAETSSPATGHQRAARNGAASATARPVPPPGPRGAPGSGEPGPGSARAEDGGTGAAEAGGSPGPVPEARFEGYAAGAFRAAMVVTRLDLDGMLDVLSEDVGPDSIRRELARFARWAEEALGRLGELGGA